MSAPKLSLHKRAGLHLPVRAIKRRINKSSAWKIECGPEAAIYLSAQLQFVATKMAEADSAHSIAFHRDFAATKRGVVTSDSVDGLVYRDPSRTFATLMRRTVPFHLFAVRPFDAAIIKKALLKPKRIPKENKGAASKKHAAAAASAAATIAEEDI